MSRSENERIEDILRASMRLAEIAKLGHEAFASDWVLQDAAARQLGIIGEAAGHLSDGLRQRVPDLQRTVRVAKGMRNHVVHKYWDTDEDIVWITLVEDIPELITMLEGEYTPPPSGSVFDEDFSFPCSGAAADGNGGRAGAPTSGRDRRVP